MKILKNFVNVIIKQDYFGQPVVMNFNGKRDNIHRTFFGGFVSLLINTLMLFYITYLFITMINYNNDSNSQFTNIFDYGNRPLQEYNFNETQLFLFIQIFDTLQQEYILLEHEEMLKYITVDSGHSIYNGTDGTS